MLPKLPLYIFFFLPQYVFFRGINCQTFIQELHSIVDQIFLSILECVNHKLIDAIFYFHLSQIQHILEWLIFLQTCNFSNFNLNVWHHFLQAHYFQSALSLILYFKFIFTFFKISSWKQVGIYGFFSQEMPMCVSFG